MTIRATKLLVLLWCLPLLLAACGGGEDQDIKEWMKEQSKDLKGRVPELPQINPLPVLAYDPGELASPFSPDKVFAEEVRAGGHFVIAGGPKDINPDAYPMSKYPLETIRLVGTITVGKELRALMAADQEPVRQVRIGDYVGQNHGRVVSIVPAEEDGQAEIVLKEVVLDKGIWIERESTLPPPEQRR